MFMRIKFLFAEETKKDEICRWLKDNYQVVIDRVLSFQRLIEHFEIDFGFGITEDRLIEQSIKTTFPKSDIFLSKKKKYPLSTLG